VREGLPETYIVQSGDNLLALGSRFGLDWRVMAALNNLNYPFVIFSGQILDLP
jgi:LysM repeat protein